MTLQLGSISLINEHMQCSTFFPSDVAATNELKKTLLNNMYIGREEGKHRGYATQVRFLLLNYYYYRQIIESIGMKVWGAKIPAFGSVGKQN